MLVTEVYFYHKCWFKCITNRALADENMIHAQSIKAREVQEMIFRHTQEMIFRAHEICIFLKDHENFLNNYGWLPLMLGLATYGIFW